MPCCVASEQLNHCFRAVYWLSCTRQRIGIVDAAGRRRHGVALAVAEEHLIGKAQRNAVRSGAAHDRLMIVVAHGVLVGEEFQIGHVVLLHVEERHDLAGIVRRAAGGGRIGRGDERLQVVQAAGRIVPGDVLAVDRAVHLLVHLEELVDGVGGIGVIGHVRAGQLERSGRQVADIGDAGVRANADGQTRAAGAEQELVAGGQAGIAAGDAEDGGACRVLYAAEVRRRQRRIQ